MDMPRSHFRALRARLKEAEHKDRVLRLVLNDLATEPGYGHAANQRATVALTLTTPLAPNVTLIRVRS